jgi:hypothetical protein
MMRNHERPIFLLERHEEFVHLVAAIISNCGLEQQPQRGFF